MRRACPQPRQRRPDLIEAPCPFPGPGEVLIAVKATALNRADLDVQVDGFTWPPQGRAIFWAWNAWGWLRSTRARRAMDRRRGLRAGRGRRWRRNTARRRRSCRRSPRHSPGPRRGDGRGLLHGVDQRLRPLPPSRPAETLLVHGGASGIGTSAIQLAARGHTGSPPPAGRSTALCARLGASGRSTGQPRVSSRFCRSAETGGKGVDVILDMVGGDCIQKNIQSLALEGRLVNIAYQNGRRRTSIFSRRAAEAADRHRLDAGAHRRQKAEVAGRVARDAWPLLESGGSPGRRQRLPLERVAEPTPAWRPAPTRGRSC